MKDGQMKRARFTEEQIIAVLKEQEAGAKTAEATPAPKSDPIPLPIKQNPPA
jgi:hypothetical protein